MTEHAAEYMLWLDDQQLAIVDHALVERDYSFPFRIQDKQRKQMMEQKRSEDFCPAELLRRWSLSARTIVVVRLPPHPQDPDVMQWVWCIRVTIDVSSRSGLARVCDRFLHALSPQQALKLWEMFRLSETWHMSSLTTIYKPSAHSPSWADHAGCSLLTRLRACGGVDNCRLHDVMSIAALRPRVVRGGLSEHMPHARGAPHGSHSSHSSITSYRGVAIARQRRGETTTTPSLFDTMPADLQQKIITIVALELVLAQGVAALSQWCALRTASTCIREAVDAAAVRWLRDGVRVGREAIRGGLVLQAVTFRDHFMTAGIDPLALLRHGVLVDAMNDRSSSGVALDSVQWLLTYMRLRSGRGEDEHPPPPEFTRMSLRHDGSRARAICTRTTRTAHRWNATLRMNMRVPREYVTILRGAGWREDTVRS